VSLLLAICLPRAGQEGPPAVPEGHVEDFETREVLDVVYDGWERVRSPAHPACNEILLREDPAGARSGRFYLRMNTLGGCTAFRMLPRRAWTIDPTRSYSFRAWARLDGTRSNTAAVTLTWMGPDLETLAEDRSVPLSRAKDWSEIALEVPRVPPQAQRVAVTLRFEGHDVRGSCDFDLLELVGRPRLDVAPQDRILPVFDPGEPPRLRVTVPAPAPEQYRLEAVTRTLEGRGVHRLEPREIVSGKPLPLEFPPHAPGYYELHLTLFRGPEEIARRLSPLVVPGPSPEPPRPLFGISLNPFTTDYAGAAGLVRLGGFRQVRITLWDRPAAGRRRAPEPAGLLSLLREIGEADPLSVVGVLADPPEGVDVDRETGRHGPLALLGADPRTWEPALGAAMRDFRGHVTHWQIGGEHYASAASRPGAAAALRTARETLRKLDRTARLGVPVEPLRERPEGADFATILLDPSAPHRGDATGELFVVLPLPPGTRLSQAAALLRTLVHHAAAEPRASAVFLPVESSSPGGLLDADGYPQAALLAVRAANAILSGTTFRGEMRFLPPPARGFLFERDGRVAAAAWCETGEAEIDLDWGEEAEIWPPLGEARPYRPGERLRLGEMPVFLRNVDAGLVETQAGLSFEDPPEGGGGPGRLPLQLDPIRKVLRFRNACPDREGLTEVRLKIGGLPEGWKVEPASPGADALGPGGEFSREILFRLPRDASEGSYEIGLELSFRRAGRPRSVRLRRTLEVVPPFGIGVESTSSGEARRVEVRVTNRSNRAALLQARIRLPGLPERTEPMSLAASEEGVRSFTVPPPREGEAAGRVVEVLCEECGGTRFHARKVVPLR